MDSSDSINTLCNGVEESIVYYNNNDGVYERIHDIENSLNNLLLDENKKKPQNLIYFYLCSFFIIGVLVTVITYLIVRYFNIY